MTDGTLNLIFGWAWMLGGVVSGAVIGLFFHRDGWAGGYASFRRRMLRLGHIAFFGLGFLNLLYGLTLAVVPVAAPYAAIAAICLVVGAVTMPLCCFLTAWRKPIRHLFAVPVLTTTLGILLTLIGWWPL